MKSLKELLEIVARDNATDLHIVVGSPPMVRVNGSLFQRSTEPLTPQETQNICLSLMTEKHRKLLETHNEVDFGFGVNGLGRFRVNVFKQRGSLSAAIRRIPEDVPHFSKLGLPQIVSDLTNKSNGLILVTGATGSGKSTTIAALLDKVNEEKQAHIVTIEDPIEYVHHHKRCIVNQREVGIDTEDFDVAMKYLLRQDPDYCLVGEMRDRETAEMALKVSETGHLVFATLHTNSAPDTISRLVSMFDEGRRDITLNQLSTVLQCVLCQQLLPGLDGKLVLAYELMIPTTGIRALIREGKVYQIHGMMQVGQQNTGMITMNQCLMNLIVRRRIDMKVGFEASPDPEDLNQMLRKAGL
jgi:twitching motility protein PilT